MAISSNISYSSFNSLGLIFHIPIDSSPVFFSFSYSSHFLRNIPEKILWEFWKEIPLDQVGIYWEGLSVNLTLENRNFDWFLFCSYDLSQNFFSILNIILYHFQSKSFIFAVNYHGDFLLIPLILFFVHLEYRMDWLEYLKGSLTLFFLFSAVNDISVN